MHEHSLWLECFDCSLSFDKTLKLQTFIFKFARSDSLCLSFAKDPSMFQCVFWIKCDKFTL